MCHEPEHLPHGLEHIEGIAQRLRIVLVGLQDANRASYRPGLGTPAPYNAGPGDSLRLGVLYVLAFSEIGSRRVIFCNAAAHPESASAVRQPRTVGRQLKELKIPITVLIRDRDSKCSFDFDAAPRPGVWMAGTPFTPRTDAAC
jgi:hypothetical protein